MDPHPQRRHGPLPLVVGVTGHVDPVPGDLPAIGAAVDQVLASLREAAGNSPVQVLSLLAEGVDQLVAERAVQQGLALVAVLPMPLAEYEATFASDAGRANLLTLWQRAAFRCELPWLDPAVRDPKPQYEQAGLVVSRFSHVMLALWNGDPYDPLASADRRLEQQGGTGHIVHLRTHGESQSRVFALSPIFPNVASLLDPPDSGPTLRIATPRLKSAECRGAAASLWLRLSAGDEEVPVSDARQLQTLLLQAVPEIEGRRHASAPVLLKQLDDANFLLSNEATCSTTAAKGAASLLLPDDAVASLGDTVKSIDDLRLAYAQADQVALHYQKHTQWAIGVLVTALPLAVASYELYAHAAPKLWLIISYLIVISISLIYYEVFVKRRHYQTQYLDYRALAEALRVQIFWALAGVTSAVSDYYLRKHRNEMSWISHALRGPGLAAVVAALTPGAPRPDLVERCWIGAEHRYFAGDGDNPGKAAWHQRRYQHCARWADHAYVFGIAVALGVLVAQCFYLGRLPADGTWQDTLFRAGLILMGLAPTVSAALTIYSEMHAAKDHAHQYGRMATIFARAAQVLGAPGARQSPDFANIVRDLGIEALSENGDWLLAHRDRPVEPIRSA